MEQNGQQKSGIELTLIGFANLLLRNRLLIAGTALTLAVVTVVAFSLTKPTFTVRASFMPQSGTEPTPLSGLASQFGVTLANGGALSAAFYADLLGRQQILGAIVDKPVAVETRTGRVQGTVAELLGFKGGSAALRRADAIKALRGATRVDYSNQTGIVNVAVRTEIPHLSQRITELLLEEVNRFNTSQRQSQAGAERKFTQQRAQEAATELRAAEEDLQRFFQRNRDYANSPSLLFEKERLSREILMRQEIYTTLMTSLENSKIAEVRDIPTITLVDTPELPALRDPRGRAFKGILALLVGTLIGILLAFVKDLRRYAAHSEPDEFDDFQKLWRATVLDMRNPVAAVVRGFRPVRN